MSKATHESKTKHRKHPLTERGCRVRIYPKEDQQNVLVAKATGAQTLRNKICDVFARDYARFKGEEAYGLTIKCTRKDISAEVDQLRVDPTCWWIRPLSKWTCERIIKQMFQARANAFEGKGRHPRAKKIRPQGPMSWVTFYNGRQSDHAYVADRRFYLPGVGVLVVRTGAGHMPDSMVRNPTVSYSRDASGRWFLSFGVESPKVEEVAEEGSRTLCEEDIRGNDAGVKNLNTNDLGETIPTATKKRDEERRKRSRRRTKKGAAQGQAARRASTTGAQRKAAQKRKRKVHGHVYAAGGEIATKRAATKKRKREKAKEARKHAERVLREKEEAKAAAIQSAGNENPEKDRGGRDATRKSRKCAHKGKGSGKGRRRPTHRRKHADRKGRRLDREVSRKQPGGKNQHKALQARAKHRAGEKDHRCEHMHQTTSSLVADAMALAIEKLNVTGLARGMLGKSVLDAALGMFLCQIRYKADWYGKPLVECPVFFPSSQLCSHCGYQHRALKLSQRMWTCPQCTVRHDRDENAAMNIKAYAISALKAEGYTITTRTPKVGGNDSRLCRE